MAAGLVGTVDFVGYPCGGGVPTPAGGTFVAGKQMIRYLINQEAARMQRSRMQRMGVVELHTRLRREADRVTFERAFLKHQEMVDTAINTILLMEV